MPQDSPEFLCNDKKSLTTGPQFWVQKIPFEHELIRISTVCFNTGISMPTTIKLQYSPETSKSRNGLILIIRIHKSMSQKNNECLPVHCLFINNRVNTVHAFKLNPCMFYSTFYKFLDVLFPSLVQNNNIKIYCNGKNLICL